MAGAARAAAGGAGGAAAWDPAEDPCPLCGTGECGSEHLLPWCPAVEAAWRTLCPEGRCLVAACRQMSGHDPLLARLLRQVVFLNGALHGRGQLDWRRSERRLVAGGRRLHRNEAGGAEDEDATPAEGHTTDVLPVWADRRDEGM